MDEGDTRYVFRFSKYIILMKTYAILKMTFFAFWSGSCTCIPYLHILENQRLYEKCAENRLRVQLAECEKK